MFQKIKQFFIENWSFIFLIFVGIIIPLSWFRSGRILGGGDHFVYYNPVNIFSNYFYTWLERINLGEPNYEIQFLFPFLLFFKIMKLLGFSNLWSEIFWAIYLFLFSGLFMYLLVSYLINEKTVWSKLSSLVAAIFYMFNPFTMIDLLQISLRPVQVAFPLLLLLWIKGLDNPVNNFKYSIFFALATLLLASSSTNPAFVAPVILAVFLYTLFAIVVIKKSFKTTLFFFLKTLVVTITFNLWWLVPSFFAYTESGEKIATAIGEIDFTHSTKIWEAFRLMGFWAFRIKSSLGMNHIPYAPSYYSFPFAFISYLFPLVAFLGMIIGSGKYKDKKYPFFFFLFLVGVFLVKGSNQPFGSLFQFVYKNVSLLGIFRNPFSKFTLLSLFSLSCFLGLSWYFIIKQFLFCYRYLLTIILIGLNILFAYPIITEPFQDLSWHHITQDSFYVDIPDYWFETGQWFLENDPSARVIQFPKSGYGTCYNWTMGTCSGEPVARMFLPNQVIKYPQTAVYEKDRILNGLYDYIFSEGQPKEIAPALGVFGVRYILQQNDLNWQRTGKNPFSPQKIAGFLQSQKQITFRKRFGELDIYEVENQAIYPWIYTVGNLSPFPKNWTEGQLSDLFSRIRFPETFFYEEDRLWEKMPESFSLPKLTFKRINPTKFEVKVEEAKGPYYLIFQSNFSRNWKVKILPMAKRSSFLNSIFKRPSVLETNHFLVNGFANGWLITPNDSAGEKRYKLLIEYQTQRFFVIFLFISSIGIIVSTGYFLLSKNSKIRKL